MHKSALFESGNDEFEWFDGKIIEDKEQESEHKEHLRFRVHWESDSQESYHSLWELMPRGDHNLTIDTSSGDLNPGEVERIGKIVDKIIKSNDFVAFNDEIEAGYREEYWKTMPYPTSLTQIKDWIRFQFIIVYTIFCYQYFMFYVHFLYAKSEICFDS